MAMDEKWKYIISVGYPKKLWWKILMGESSDSDCLEEEDDEEEED
jgi:hypothetical protein